jgi:membrane protein
MSLAALKRTALAFQKNDGTGLAAQLAYYLILALFPLILVFFSVLGTFSSPELANSLLGYFGRVLPGQVYGLIEAYMGGILSGDKEAPGLLSFGVLGTLWAASGAFSALINALNKAYGVEESRPFWKVKLLAVLMTLALSGIVLAAVVLLVFGPQIGAAISGYFGLDAVFDVVWNVVRWGVALLFLMLTVALIYYVAPDVEQPLRWITPGGIFGVLLWVLASMGFSFYVGNFGSYNETYGSIGAVIVLLLYLYISSLAILFGAELNATLVRMKEEISGEQVLRVTSEEPGEAPQS